MRNRPKTLILSGLLVAAFPLTALAVEEALPEGEVLMKAMSDELARSMDLTMEDLEKPYFIVYTADDSLNYSLAAAYGAITSFDRDRSRRFSCQVRVGSYELDNTNFAGGGGGFTFRMGGGRRGGRGGGRASLPIDDDKVDVATMILVLHLLEQPETAIREAARCLRPGGQILIVDMLPHDRAEYQMEKGHVWLGFSENTIKEFVENAGFGDARFQRLPPAPEAKGPSLFTVSAHLRSENK